MATYAVTSADTRSSANVGDSHFCRVLSAIFFSMVFSLPLGFLDGLADGTQSAGQNASNALPWPAPSIPGMMPSSQPPQPTGTTTYCLPSTLYVEGLLWWPLPHWNSHSFSPVRALSATNSPVGGPAN